MVADFFEKRVCKDGHEGTNCFFEKNVGRITAKFADLSK